MDPVKIPKMPKAEYDALIERQYVSRISFGACDHPYIAPFMYVFDKKYLYFLSTKYGRKMEYFARNPKVSVEIEEYAPDLSAFTFVSLQGILEEVKDPAQKKKVREQFVEHDCERTGFRPGSSRLLVTTRMTTRTCWSARSVLLSGNWSV